VVDRSPREDYGHGVGRRGLHGERLINGNPWDAPGSLAAVRAASAPDVELVDLPLDLAAAANR